MSAAVSANGSIGGKAPPPAVKPRPKSNSVTSSDKPKVAPPVAKKKPVAAPVPASPPFSRSPVARSPDASHSPMKKARPPPPARNQSLAIPGDESPLPAPPAEVMKSVSVKEAAEMVLADNFPPPPPPLSPPSQTLSSPPPVLTKPKPAAVPAPGPDIAPRPRGRASTGGSQLPPPPSFPPTQPNGSARKPSIDEQKYNEIEDMISGFMSELDDKDFFSKAMEEFSDDVSTV